MAKDGMVAAAGKIALVFVAFGTVVIIAFYLGIYLTGVANLWLGLTAFAALIVVAAILGALEYSRLFEKSKGLKVGNMDEWVLLVTVLAAAFAIGAAFQSISTFESTSVSRSSCIIPTNVNVTSPNCNQIQTTSQTEGPFLYFGQLGVLLLVLASIGAIAFAAVYLTLRSGLSSTP